MKERFVEIETPSGRMETFVTHPEQDGPFPAVIVYMDIWGVREELFEIARRVGTVGYYWPSSCARVPSSTVTPSTRGRFMATRCRTATSSMPAGPRATGR